MSSKAVPPRNCQKAANEDVRCQFAKSLGKLNLTSPRHQCQAASSAKEALNPSGNRIVLDSRKAEASSRTAASSGYKGSLSGPPRLLPRELSDPFLDVPVALPPPLIPTPAFARGGMSQSLNPPKRPVPVPPSDPSFSYPDLLSSEVIIGYALENQKVTASDVVGTRGSKSRCDVGALKQNRLVGGAGDEVLTTVNYESLNCDWELQKVLSEKLSVAVDDTKAEKLDCVGAECAVCLERPPDCALYTCGHMCMCYGCAMSVMKSRGATCPICRKPVLDVIKIFKS